MNLEKLLTYPHISDYSFEDLILNVGLYQNILISTQSKSLKTETNGFTGNFLMISDDVDKLYQFIKLKNPLLLPCKDCKKELPFNNITNPTKSINSEPFTQCISSNPDDYYPFSDVLISVENNINITKHELAFVRCKETLLNNFSTFSFDFRCTYNLEHIIQCFFKLEAIPEIEDEIKNKVITYEYQCRLDKLNGNHITKPTNDIVKAQNLIKEAKYVLVMKKVGQYPSLSDIQFYEAKKYQKLLKDQYSEYTRALGLHASGVGVGSFVYLRRIFENLVEEHHKECLSLDNWDDSEYQKRHFNEKLVYMDSFGRSILPEELLPIKNKLYGVISKGVHEYTENECLEIFPHIQLAIELILDKELERKQRELKIKYMTSAISKA